MAEIVFSSKSDFFQVLSKIISALSNQPGLLDLINSYGKSLGAEENLDMMISAILPEYVEIVSSFNPTSPKLDSNIGDPDRIYMDGCFDLMHSGHYNAIRQAKSLGKVLVVGVHSDAEIARNKGPPVMKEQERYLLARSCKWVDEVIEDAPYSPTIELLNSLNCRYAAHGDDLSINENGDDCMSILKRAGRCKIFKRTEGISTTQLVGKLLLMTKDVWQTVEIPVTSNAAVNFGIENSQVKEKHLLTTSRRLSEFSNKREPHPGDVIVYIDGTFDLFHIGHVETLKRAKALGNFLIVGVHDDATVNRYKGSNFPIMSLHDRAMCVLSTKYVDEVIIGAPWKVTRDLITSFNIHIVVQGTVLKTDDFSFRCRKGSIDVDEDPFIVPKEMGIYKEIESVSKINTQEIIDRIIQNRVNLLGKFTKSSEREEKYSETKTFIQEV